LIERRLYPMDAEIYMHEIPIILFDIKEYTVDNDLVCRIISDEDVEYITHLSNVLLLNKSRN
jgi:hypothetical protein